MSGYFIVYQQVMSSCSGTREERGLVAWEDQHDGEDSAGAQSKTDRFEFENTILKLNLSQI